ncbi:TIGR04076 family protein [Chloroflexota bacterium]
MKYYDVQVTVKSVTGKACTRGLKKGDVWLVKEGKLTPEGICTEVWATIWPWVRTFVFGGEQPWDRNKDYTYVSCPDPERQLIFEVKRLREE